MQAGGKQSDASLPRILEELDRLKEGLRLLGLSQCGSCGKYFQLSEGKPLFDAGQPVCYNCVGEWWRERSPALGIEERKAVEHKLLRWLVAHHGAKVIRQSDKMPPAAHIQLKIMVACEQCDGTGKAGGKDCHSCEGRGSVWVVRLRPEVQW